VAVVKVGEAVEIEGRIEGQGESVLRGVGIVTGLKGTGDSGADLVLARPLAERVYVQVRGRGVSAGKA
jgi:flagellar basal body P-ring protein FlgI